MNESEFRHPDKAITELEAAELLCKSVQTLRNDRHLGRGCPYLKMGRSVRYLVSDIKDYRIANRIVPEDRK